MNCDSLIKFSIYNPENKNKYSNSKDITIYEKEFIFEYYDDENKFSSNTLYETLSNIDIAPDYSEISIKENSFELSTIKDFYNDLKNINIIKDNQLNLTAIFYNCISLKTLPDLSCWNQYNIIGITRAFQNCSSLISLPDISNWNINNVIYMDKVFYNCSSLLSLPDISK